MILQRNVRIRSDDTFNINTGADVETKPSLTAKKLQ